MIAVVLVAPFWVGAYIVAGWGGVAFMALLALAAEIVVWNADEQQRWRDVAIAHGRWDQWNG